jgi:hypothetical protein
MGSWSVLPITCIAGSTRYVLLTYVTLAPSLTFAISVQLVSFIFFCTANKKKKQPLVRPLSLGTGLVKRPAPVGQVVPTVLVWFRQTSFDHLTFLQMSFDPRFVESSDPLKKGGRGVYDVPGQSQIKLLPGDLFQIVADPRPSVRA